MKPPAYNNAEEVQQISQEQGERNVAMAVCVQLAGRAIIRVVSRCEEAQDNCNLGECRRYGPRLRGRLYSARDAVCFFFFSLESRWLGCLGWL